MVTIDVVELVPKDLIFLRGGNIVPADCRWLEGDVFQVRSAAVGCCWCGRCARAGAVGVCAELISCLRTPSPRTHVYIHTRLSFFSATLQLNAPSPLPSIRSLVVRADGHGGGAFA